MTASVAEPVSVSRYLMLAVRVIAYCAVYWVIAFRGFEYAGIVPDFLGVPPVWRMTVQGVIYAAVVLAVTFAFRCLIERRSWSGMPLRLSRFGGVAVGFLAGALTLAILTFVELLLGYLHLVGTDIAASGVQAALTLAGASLLLYGSTAFAEEVVFRGYLFQTLGEKLPAWAATVISGAIFAGFHFTNGGFNGPTALSIVFFTLLFVSARLLFDSLWWAVGWHAAWDWMQFSVLGIAYVNIEGHGRALYQFDQTGPLFLVGEAPSIEGGTLVMVLVGVNLVVLIAIMAARGLTVDWTAKPALPDGDGAQG